mmetsp:Transcript_148797/g.477931  ORF Transcript_148797/g.477931 Transcript_148797/m.477931 type:complete len:261 (-) Transcript_148797:303-1085(-)
MAQFTRKVRGPGWYPGDHRDRRAERRCAQSVWRLAALLYRFAPEGLSENGLRMDRWLESSLHELARRAARRGQQGCCSRAGLCQTKRGEVPGGGRGSRQLGAHGRHQHRCDVRRVLCLLPGVGLQEFRDAYVYITHRRRLCVLLLPSSVRRHHRLGHGRDGPDRQSGLRGDADADAEHCVDWALHVNDADQRKAQPGPPHGLDAGLGAAPAAPHGHRGQRLRGALAVGLLGPAEHHRRRDRKTGGWGAGCNCQPCSSKRL